MVHLHVLQHTIFLVVVDDVVLVVVVVVVIIIVAKLSQSLSLCLCLSFGSKHSYLASELSKSFLFLLGSHHSASIRCCYCCTVLLLF